MRTERLLASLAILFCLAAQAESQADPLGSNVFNIPSDLRGSNSLGGGYSSAYQNPQADPLAIDPLMRPLDPEHTWEYLDIVSGRAYAGEGVTAPYLRGNWRLDLRDSSLRHLDLTLQQNRDVVFGRGVMSIGGIRQSAFASGLTSGDVLYIDVLSDELILYKCTLTVAGERLSGSYYAFDPQGRVWNGMAAGSR